MIEEFTECFEEATDDVVEAFRVRPLDGCALFGRTLGLKYTYNIKILKKLQKKIMLKAYARKSQNTLI